MDVQGITIDSLGTRDRDDAVWAEIDARGWTATVCIANVTAAISKGSAFDITAYRRVEASCLPGSYSRPLLPRRFSEGSCAIMQGKERSVMAIRIRLDHELEIRSVSIDESTLVSSGQLHYEDVAKILETKDREYYPALSRLKNLAEGLLEKRRDRGAFAIFDPDTGWITTEDGYLQKIDANTIAGYVIVQELMILANVELARFCAENNIPILFRNHSAKIAAPDRGLIMEKMTLGLRGSAPDLDAVRRLFAMVLQKSNYSPVASGHYGLNLPAYMHGTSPMRRFADLVSQRQILAYINKLRLPYHQDEILEISNHINDEIESRARETAQASLERANRRAQSLIRKGDLLNLSDKEFERVLKLSIRSNEFNERVSEAFLNRLDVGRSTIAEMQFVLFHSGDSWKRTCQPIIDHLSKYPYKAMAIASVATQIEGWSEPSYKIHREGSGRFVFHVAQAWFKKPGLESRPVRAASCKIAKQRAVVESLAKFFNLLIAPWSDRDQENAGTNLSLPPRESNNAINDLGEYCQRINESAPSFEVKRDGGKDHAPFFIATCQALDFCVRSTPQSSKRLAKRMAALTIIDLLHAKIDNENIV